MSSAAAWPPSAAAWEVRTLARVAAFIPRNPAMTEHTAPAKNATAVTTPSCHARSSATTTTNTASTVYSRFRKAMAPS